ncbi:hypothetical protein AB1Y20_023709 [Prymnesium parvum]|uniref:Pyridoxamine 5'-phosphate oxidase Alr4036 family FMN-binding domain-containing protein n=1 Tax=Prymnesium parvum TaxID=97485 RepID=A0AB34JHW7_PRYPA
MPLTLPLESLDATFAHAWRLLRLSVAPRRSPPLVSFRTPVVASSDASGAPQQRVMVLRAVECDGYDAPGPPPSALPRLRFHTDVRSRKCAELSGGARCGVLFYDKAEKLQLRAAGRAQLHELRRQHAEAARAWGEAAPMSRKCYFVDEAPGQAVSLEALRGLREALRGVDTQRAEPPSPHFACIVVHVSQLELLYLSHDDSRRAVARYSVADGGASDGSAPSSGGEHSTVRCSYEWLVP